MTRKSGPNYPIRTARGPGDAAGLVGEESPGSTEGRCRVTPGDRHSFGEGVQGQCHRSRLPVFRRVKAKGCGKSAPRGQERDRHGKPHREQRPNRGGHKAFCLVARCWLLEGGVTASERNGRPVRRSLAKVEDRTRLTGPLALLFLARGWRSGAATLMVRTMAKPRREPTIGVCPACALTARAAKRRRCAAAIATAATRLATGPHPRSRTARSAGISASPTPPNITATGITFAGLDPKRQAGAQSEESAAPRLFVRQAWQWGGAGDGTRSRDEMRPGGARLGFGRGFRTAKAAPAALAKEKPPRSEQGDRTPRCASSRSRPL